MREENYFVKKLEMAKETIVFAKSNLDHLDVQINVLQVRFEHDKKVYNDQAIHMQNVISDMEKRIPDLEKKIAQGYTTIDMRTGKGYKSFDARHVGMLQDKLKASEDARKERDKAYKEKRALKKRSRDKLTPEELDTVIAEQVREEAQPADELKEVRNKEMERLKLKEEFYRTELEKLKQKPKEVKKKEPEPIEELLEELVPPEEDAIEDQKALLEEVKDIANEKLSELHEGKVQCPECKEWFTKGGAFAKHYQSHFNGD